MENENIVKETALSVAKETAKDVYADTVQPTAMRLLIKILWLISAKKRAYLVNSSPVRQN